MPETREPRDTGNGSADSVLPEGAGNLEDEAPTDIDVEEPDGTQRGDAGLTRSLNGADLTSEIPDIDPTEVIASPPSSAPTAALYDGAEVLPMKQVGRPGDGSDAAEEAFRALEEKRRRRRRKRTVKIVIAVVIVLALAFAGALWIRAKMAENAAAADTTTTDTVRQGSFDREVTGTGKLQPVKSVSISPEIDGTVDAVYVAEGDTVTEGQTLFTIKSDTVEQAITTATQGVATAQLGVKQAQSGVNQAVAARDAAVNSYNAQVSSAANAVNSANAAVTQAQSAYSAAVASGDATKAAAAKEELAQATSAASQAASTYNTLVATGLDTMQLDAAIESANLALDSANLQLQSAQTGLDTANKNGDKRTVKATMSGQVTSFSVKVGTSVTSLATSGTAACEIGDLSQLVMKMQVNEVDIVDIKTGLSADVTFDAVSGLSSNATVTRVSTTSQSSSQSTSLTSLASGSSTGVVYYDVDLTIAKPDAHLKPGMTANATIAIQHIDNALQVPISALQGDTGDKYVTVIDGDGTQRTVKVTVVSENDNYAAVQGNLTAGETVTTPFSTSSSSKTTSLG